MKPERIQFLRIIGDAAKAAATKFSGLLGWIVEALKGLFRSGNSDS